MKHTTAGTAIVLALVVAACSGGDDAASTSPPTTEASSTTSSTTSSSSTTTTSSTSSSTTTTTEAPPEDLYRMPLTGEPIEGPADVVDRPALAVKIDNHPRAHPQAGLNEADIVYEEIVEFGTRFAAIFHTQGSDPLGPIRSGRSQDVGILASLDQPLFAWSGGNAGVRSIIRQSPMIDLDAGFSPGYYRRSGRSGAPHNLFSSTEALWLSTPDDHRVPPQQFPYLAEGDEPDGEEATLVTLTMDGRNIRWEYDEESETYLRSERGSPHQTELTGQVSTDNVVVMAVEYRPSVADRTSPEAQVTGSGPVVVFSRGVARIGHWTRDSILDPYTFVVDLPDPDESEESDESQEAEEPDDDTGDTDTGDADGPDPGLDPFTDTDADADADADLIGLTPGRTWVALQRDAENFVTWE